jgi:EF hand
MSEKIYGWLLKLYPVRFRRDYGSSAIQLFRDRIRAERGILLQCRLWFDVISDLTVSVPSEHLRRSVAEPKPNSREYLDGIPMFLVLDDDPRLTGGQWVGGAALSLLVFAMVSFLIAHGGSHSRLVIGSHATSRAGVRVQSAGVSDLTTEVTMDDADTSATFIARRLVARYFENIRVLSALDLNHDLVISAEEIANAPRALRTLDANGDGALDAEECGNVFTGDFMRINPVLAALDADHDGLISGSEIRNAPAALERLDKNRDGKLTAEELLPDPLLKRVHVLLREKGINHEQ